MKTIARFLFLPLSVLLLFTPTSVKALGPYGVSSEPTVEMYLVPFDKLEIVDGAISSEQIVDLNLDDFEKVDVTSMKYSDMPMRSDATVDAVASYAVFLSLQHIRIGMTFQMVIDSLKAEKINFELSTFSRVAPGGNTKAHDIMRLSFSKFLFLELTGFSYDYDINSVSAINEDGHLFFKNRMIDDMLSKRVSSAEMICLAPYAPEIPEKLEIEFTNPQRVLVNLEGMAYIQDYFAGYESPDELQKEIIKHQEDLK